MNRKLIVAALCLIATFACKKKEAPTPEPAAPPVAATTDTQPPPKPAIAPQPTVTLAAGAPIPAGGVALWLQADDAKAGEKLPSWTNPAVANVVASATAPEQQPMVVANAINGHAVVRFDGGENLLATNVDISPARMPEATIFAVFNSHTDAASPLRKLYGDDNGGYDRAAGLDDRAAGKNFSLFTGHGVEGDFQLEKDKFYVTTDQFAAKDVSTWVNGHTTLKNIETAYEDALPAMFIGGTGTTYKELWQGDLAEIIVYGRVLSEHERTQVEDYLAKKYGVTLTRP